MSAQQKVANLSPAAKFRLRWMLKTRDRPNQRTPAGKWHVWLILAGRGWGKTRTGAEDMAYYALDNPGVRCAVIAPTYADARDTCVEGESGLIACIPPEELENWNRSLGEVILKNGSRIKLFSAEEPNRLRGPQHHRVWCVAGETPVLMADKTERRIDRVRVGDLVMTPSGPGVVTASECTAIGADLWELVASDGRAIVGTADHPVWCDGRFQPLGDLVPGGIMSTWLHESFTTARHTGSTARTTTETHGASCSTGSNGKASAVLSRRATSCTTSTRTSWTTGSKIWRLWRRATTIGTTGAGVGQHGIAPSAPPSRERPGRASHRNSVCVSTVAANTQPGAHTATGAVSSAERLPAITVSRVRPLKRTGRVYNLTIAGSHQFYANGILTHNCDELASWKYPETWDQMQFGLRLGDDPRVIVTTTPRPTKLVKELRAHADVHITVGSTFDNAANLAPAALGELRARYEGTRLGRQELYAELLEDVEGALWTLGMLDDARIETAPDMARAVVSIDPSGGDGEGNDEQGIMVTGRGIDGLGYVLADRSCKLSPSGWASRALAAYDEFNADRIVAEKNYGGDMVAATIKSLRPNVKVVMVTASRGKRQRAEPVAALYEQGKVKHAGVFALLEEQLTTWTPESGTSPDRLDALVWGLTDLMLERDRRPTFLGAA